MILKKKNVLFETWSINVTFLSTRQSVQVKQPPKVQLISPVLMEKILPFDEL